MFFPQYFKTDRDGSGAPAVILEFEVHFATEFKFKGKESGSEVSDAIRSARARSFTLICRDHIVQSISMTNQSNHYQILI